MKTRIYLAGPIFGCTDAQAYGWRNRLHEIASHYPQLQLIDPARRDERGREDSAYIDIVNEDKRDIDSCAFLLANCWKDSVGTSMEIMYAYERRKGIIVVVPQGRPVSPWYRAHAGKIGVSSESALYLLMTWGLVR